LHHGVYKRAPFVGDSEMSDGFLLSSGVLHLPRHMLLAILLLHPLDLTGIRGNRTYTTSRITSIRRLYDDLETRKKFFQWCRLAIGSRLTTQVDRLVANQFKYTRLTLLRMKLLLFIHNRKMLHFFLKRIVSKFSPPPSMRGRVISVMGVDGSGKTTLLSELLTFSQSYIGNIEKVCYSYMGKQGGYRLPLQWLSGLLRRIQKNPICANCSSINVSDLSRESEARRTFDRPIWQLIFFAEYSIRLIEIWFLILFRRRIVFTDRYVDDFFQDDNVNFMVRLLMKLFPKPSHVFMIVGDTEVFFERKREYSPDELAAVQEKLLTRVRYVYGDRLTILDGNKPASAVLEQALAALHSP
jgi:thymidylate kinase